MLHVVRADVVPHLDAADVSVVVKNSGDQPINDATISVEVLPAGVTDTNLLAIPDPLSLGRAAEGQWPRSPLTDCRSTMAASSSAMAA